MGKWIIKMIPFLNKCQDDLGESTMNTESMQERIVFGNYCIFRTCDCSFPVAEIWELGNAQRSFHAAGTSQILTLNRVTPLKVFIVLRAS